MSTNPHQDQMPDPDWLSTMTSLILQASPCGLASLANDHALLRAWIAKRIEAYMPTDAQVDALTQSVESALRQQARDNALPADSPRRQRQDRIYR